jgi:Putative  PD-(D/E)XK family member, (DUF4420)
MRSTASVLVASFRTDCWSTKATTGALTAEAIVAAIRQTIEHNQTARTEFELRLAEAGYADNEEYTRAWYHPSGVRYFHVRRDFPRLTSTTVPAGVHDVTYVIDLHACAPFAVTFPTRQD